MLLLKESSYPLSPQPQIWQYCLALLASNTARFACPWRLPLRRLVTFCCCAFYKWQYTSDKYNFQYATVSKVLCPVHQGNKGCRIHLCKQIDSIDKQVWTVSIHSLEFQALLSHMSQLIHNPHQYIVWDLVVMTVPFKAGAQNKIPKTSWV